MFWECRESILSESDISITMVGETWIREWDWRYSKKFLNMYESSAVDESNSTDRDMVIEKERVLSYRRWYSVVANYSRRQLTFPSDVLSALAGLAIVFQHRLGDRYLAGLFSGDILRGMLWQV